MENHDDDESVKEEKDKLEKLGVSETWSLLKDSDNKKKKPDQEKPAFRGFN